MPVKLSIPYSYKFAEHTCIWRSYNRLKKGQKIYIWIYFSLFSYNGKAPDAFFYVGTSDRPSESGIKIEYPPGSDKTLGKEYDNAMSSLQAQFLYLSFCCLGVYKDERVAFKLPKGVKGSDLTWISVWCREFKWVRYTVPGSNRASPHDKKIIW